MEDRVTGFRFDDLGQNERFVSATLQATQAALRSHQKEKLEALRNAVLNVAVGRNFSDEQQGVFLSLLDTLQPIHLNLLRFFADPPGYCRFLGKPPMLLPAGGDSIASHEVLKLIPELRNEAQLTAADAGSSQQLVDLVIGDLISDQLIKLPRAGDIWILRKPYAATPTEPDPAITEFGKSFLTFITEPQIKA